MKTPNPQSTTARRPRRPARSIKEIRRRQRGEDYQSPMALIFYALLTALLYGAGGLFIDLAIVVIRSLFNLGTGDIFWLFTPILLVLGAIIGFFVGKNAGAESVNALHNPQASNNAYLDDYSIRHDIFRGLMIGIAIFAVIWLVMMLMT
ncbi:hypothetical protein [Psychrobacter sp. HII-4]|uniref:hypothetical protein n=1 Tax=Psychrobacter sp. HII-4 TaxID=1569264 RepID=UPI00191A319A|nr:hypothetical protein [Psychrobacter sp. HII-4]